MNCFITDRRKSKRHLSWLRNSMRKTKPIELPEQDLVPVPAAYTNDAFQYNESEPSTLQSTDESTTDSYNSFNTVYFDANSCNTLPYLTVPLTTPEEQDNQQRSSSSSGAAIHQSTEMLEQDDIINVILNTSNADSSGTSVDDSPRPRQLGRRSESRPRVVSIDVSSTPEIRRTPLRPVSVPSARVHLEPPSEDSSVGGSSRNPSPISVVSSGASSSAASTVENNNQR